MLLRADEIFYIVNGLHTGCAAHHPLNQWVPFAFPLEINHPRAFETDIKNERIFPSTATYAFMA